VLSLLCLAFFVDVLGSTSVFTASPELARGLGLTQAGLQWSFTAATLPAGALLLVGGRLADLFGRRLLFLVGLALFTGSSLACGLAGSATQLIAARAGQGIAGALLIPAALSLLTGTFPEGRERNRAVAAWSAIGGIGATAGLLIGGLVTAGAGWQWVFLINVPVGMLLLAAGPYLLPEPPRVAESRRIDLPGSFTITGGLSLVIYGVSQIPSVGFASWRSAGAIMAGLAMLAIFARIETRSREPMLPRALIRSRSVVAGNLVLLVAGMCVDGLLFTLTLYTQRLLGYGPLEFGALTAIMTMVSAAAASAAQRAIGRSGPRVVAAIGLGFLTVTCLVFAIATSAALGLLALVAGMITFGFGMGCAFVAGSVAALGGIPERDSGAAAAVQSISFTVGTTLGVALLSTASAVASSYTAGFVTGAIIAILGLSGTLISWRA
jgi:MFS family permease